MEVFDLSEIIVRDDTSINIFWFFHELLEFFQIAFTDIGEIALFKLPGGMKVLILGGLVKILRFLFCDWNIDLTIEDIADILWLNMQTE